MELRVNHLLRYEYSSAVFLQPHTLYLYPRIYPHQRLDRYTLRIDPKPDMQVQNIDVEGNVQQIIYFNQSADSLTVEAEMVVQSTVYNSFDFVLFPFEAQKLPFTYSASDQILLAPYLERVDVTSLVDQYARQLASEAKWQTVPFLSLVCTTIWRNFTYQVRQEGPAHSPEETLTSRQGSCRDYTVLYIAICRSLGLAARFVSGYLYGSPQQEHELHAWAEVYLPGAGWRGFDPSEGSVVTNQHIFLAASRNHNQLAPLAGTFRGSAQSTMTATVTIAVAEY